MIQYPSIPHYSRAPLNEKCLAFYKFDGSNLRFEWNKKRGWHKFGTRHQLFDSNTELYGQSIPLLHEIADDILSRLSKKFHIHDRVVIFTEFFGPNSFSGIHELNDPKTLRLIDVFIFKHGRINPNLFHKMFVETNYSSPLVYDGNLNKQFIRDVQENKFNLTEGVVCKTSDWMCKIKTNDFLNKLRVSKIKDDFLNEEATCWI